MTCGANKTRVWGINAGGDRALIEMVGRPKGLPKTGGRKKGTRNKLTVAREAAFAESGLSRLDFLLSILRDDNAPDREQLRAAKTALSLCHGKPRPIKVNANVPTVKVRYITHEERLAELDALAEEDALAQAPPVESVMDQMEAQWFNMDSPDVAHAPALPACIQPRRRARVPHETSSLPGQWNGNGAGRPRPGNGVDAHRPQTPPGERRRPRFLSD